MSETTSNDYESLKQLATEFWDWRRINQPISSDDLPRIERSATWIPIWSREAIETRRRELPRFASRYKSIDATAWTIPQQVDYRLIGSAIARVNWELEIVRAYERNPGFYVDQTLGALYERVLKPLPFDEVRQNEVLLRVANFPQLVRDAKLNLEGTAVKPFAVAAVEKISDVRSLLTRVSSELRPHFAPHNQLRLDEIIPVSIDALESFCGWLQDHLSVMSKETAVGREAYIHFLKHIAIMPFTPEQLLSMATQEWERSAAFETFEQVRNSGLPELNLFPDQATQMTSEEQQEGAIREFLVEKQILSVPSWVQHYRNLPMPGYVEPLTMMGVADDLTSETRLNENGISYIRKPSPGLDYFSLSIAKDPRPLIVHEGVPGHYFQLALSWGHENPIRRFYYDSGSNEGIGFYAEELMMQFGLFDDSPRTREIMYNFMRLRALRVEVDVKLATGLFTIDQAADYLETMVPVDRATARQEAVFFAASPGQAITYQIGKLQITKFLADAKLRQKEVFNLQTFHDYLWKNGNVPISLLRWEFLGLTDEIEHIDHYGVGA